MLRAVLVDGKIEALDPLPPDWHDGQELVVDQAARNGAEASNTANELLDLQRRAGELRTLGEARFEPGEWETVQSILDEQRRVSKEQVRQQMGL